jgi:hypothetical protein
MRAFVNLLLRMYPRTWRMRYEEEVRAFLDDRPPGWRDLVGFARGAVAERARLVLDPVAHPLLSGVVFGLSFYFAVVTTITITAQLVASLLEQRVGVPPSWVGSAAAFGQIAAMVRGLHAFAGWAERPLLLGFTMRPLTRAASRRWWIVLWLSVMSGMWAGNPRFVWDSMYWIAPVLLLQSTEVAWSRQRTGARLWQVRREYVAAIKEHTRINRLIVLGLSKPSELGPVAADLARLTAEVKAASAAYRAARLWQFPPARPLGLG